MAIVYMHRRKSNGEPFYIGVGKHESRAFSKASRNRHWHNIVNDEGYVVEILQRDLSYEMALSQEKLLIAEIGRRDLGKGPLVNYNDGGLGGSNPNQNAREEKSQRMKDREVSEETKQKISDSHKGKKLSQETKKKISTSSKGNTNMKTNFTKSVCPKCGKEGQTSSMMRWHFDNCGVAGKVASEKAKSKNATRSDESKQKMSEARKGKLLSQETKQKISDSHKGKKLSQETKDKIIQTKKQNGTLHKKRTEQQVRKGLQTKLEKGNYYPTQETKKKISESLKGLVQSRIQCPHCNKIGGVSGMKRYHFDNCKHKM